MSLPAPTIHVPAMLGRIAAGEGGVWITEGHRGQRVYRIDPKTNTVAATLSVGEEPWDIGVVAGAVWVGGRGAIHRIDPATNAVTSIPFGGYSRVAFMVRGQGAYLVRRDPQTLRPVGSPLRLPSFVGQFTTGFDSVWIVSRHVIQRVPVCKRRWLPWSTPSLTE
jgi:DNA-binding beta-propeller fold protein YncE